MKSFRGRQIQMLVATDVVFLEAGGMELARDTAERMRDAGEGLILDLRGLRLNVPADSDRAAAEGALIAVRFSVRPGVVCALRESTNPYPRTHTL